MSRQTLEKIAEKIWEKRGRTGGWNKRVAEALCPKLRERQQEIDSLLAETDEARRKANEACSAYKSSNESAKEARADEWSVAYKEYLDLLAKRDEMDASSFEWTNFNLDSRKDSTLSLEEIQPILDALEFGSSQDKSRRLRPGQFVHAAYVAKDAKGSTSGHAFSLISGHYDPASMKIGEKIQIGHMNYIGDKGPLYMKKTKNDEVQLVYFEAEIPMTDNFKLTKLELYTDFLTEYEPNPETITSS